MFLQFYPVSFIQVGSYTFSLHIFQTKNDNGSFLLLLDAQAIIHFVHLQPTFDYSKRCSQH